MGIVHGEVEGKSERRSLLGDRGKSGRYGTAGIYECSDEARLPFSRESAGELRRRKGRPRQGSQGSLAADGRGGSSTDALDS